MNELISISEIVRKTAIDRSVLNRYLAIDENRALLGGEASHPQYPAERLPLFYRLAQEHAAGVVTPKTLAARFRSEFGKRNSDTENRIADSAQQAGAMVRLSESAPRALDAVERYTVALERHAAALEAFPAPDDELLTMAQARERYGVSMSILRGLRVTVGKRRYVRRSDVLRFIQEL